MNLDKVRIKAFVVRDILPRISLMFMGVSLSGAYPFPVAKAEQETLNPTDPTPWRNSGQVRQFAPSKYGPDGPPPTIVPDPVDPMDSAVPYAERNREPTQTRPMMRFAQNNSKKPDPRSQAESLKNSKATSNKKTKAQQEPAELLEMSWTPIEIKSFSPKEIKSLCYQYEGKLVAYYSDVYKIQNCKRRLIVDSKTVYELVAKGEKVVDVDRDLVIALPEGEPLDLAPFNTNAAQLCRRLEGRYVTYSYVDVYYIEGCKRRLFPDWTTYTTHRTKKGGDPKGTFEALPVEEFSAIPEGEPIPSVVDEMFAKLLSGEAGIDVIPIDEACKGVNNQVVSFYSRLYKIEKCYKREIFGFETIFKVTDYETKKIEELTAEKWLSLPNGVPLPLKSADRFHQQDGPPNLKK
jgi:hypothetical protein